MLSLIGITGSAVIESLSLHPFPKNYVSKQFLFCCCCHKDAFNDTKAWITRISRTYIMDITDKF